MKKSPLAVHWFQEPECCDKSSSHTFTITAGKKIKDFYLKKVKTQSYLCGDNMNIESCLMLWLMHPQIRSCQRFGKKATEPEYQSVLRFSSPVQWSGQKTIVRTYWRAMDILTNIHIHGRSPLTLPNTHLFGFLLYNIRRILIYYL